MLKKISPKLLRGLPSPPLPSPPLPSPTLPSPPLPSPPLPSPPLPSPPFPSLPFPSLPPSLPLVTQRIHSPFQPKQSPSKTVAEHALIILPISPSRPYTAFSMLSCAFRPHSWLSQYCHSLRTGPQWHYLPIWFPFRSFNIVVVTLAISLR